MFLCFKFAGHLERDELPKPIETSSSELKEQEFLFIFLNLFHRYQIVVRYTVAACVNIITPTGKL